MPFIGPGPLPNPTWTTERDEMSAKAKEGYAHAPAFTALAIRMCARSSRARLLCSFRGLEFSLRVCTSAWDLEHCAVVS